MGKYDDIINLPHHVSAAHSQMSMHDRAAQFSPFAALTGYDDTVRETARLTDEKKELTSDKISDLNKKIAFLAEHAGERPEITVEYFIPDEKKSGGRYGAFSGRFRRIDEYNFNMVFVSGEKIPLDDICKIDISIF
ncbi:MAG: hypothetical protein NC120_13330 [Ruminococcus sp.]|nr:hypothetical protein [Ruminococcus sp.]